MHAPDFWLGRSALDRAVAWSLAPLGSLYALGGRVRFAVTRPVRVGLCVICVGNLTAGGTGKTPVAIAIGQWLKARGIRFAFLSRGYGGRLRQPTLVDPARHQASETGDEPLLLAAHGPTVVSADGVACARLAEAQGIKVIIMDDGFQNPGLHKDFSIVVVDAASGFGNGFVIPAGPLRETVAQGLRRAQALVLMGDGGFAPVTSHPCLRARLEADEDARQQVAGRKVAAFAGIGRPEKFFASLRAAGANVVLTRPFADHYAYTPADWAMLDADAQEYRAQLVTTEKDWVRLRPEWRSKTQVFTVQAQFADTALLDQLLSEALKAHV